MPTWLIPALLLAAALLLFDLLRKRTPRPASSSDDGAGKVDDPSAPVEAATSSRVASVEVSPDKLVVNIFAHTIEAPDGPVRCWSYVSDGLWALGQKEIVFTVRRRKGEPKGAYPRDLLRIHGLVHELAGEGRLVDVGDTSSFRGAGLLGRSDFLGVLYTQPQLLPGVHIEAPWLQALILTEGEHAVAQQFGVVRLMATLGKRYRYFPTAPWVDRDRSELCSPDDMKASFLAKVPRQCLYAASVRQESRKASAEEEHERQGGIVDRTITLSEQRVVLRLRPGAAARLKKAMADLPADAAIALLVGPDPSSSACLAWEPGQEQPSAITAPGVMGECIAGNFIVFVPAQEEDGAMPIEDGFAVFLRDETWQRIREALNGGRPFSLAAAGEEKLGLEIVWAPELDPDFADPVESHMPGGGAAFGGHVASSEPVYMKSIALLTVTSVLERRVESMPLSEYMKAIMAAVTSHLDGAPAGPGQDLALQCEVRPDGGRAFEMAIRPGPAGGPLEGLRERLMELPPPPVVFGPIRFQLNIQLWGGRGKTA
ncbi:hypothetical protein [Polyangium aurulentum]|uniref:hypothetical protein n=1 Tax=Polyangium aurulentum TaxID=2567896 RepID=UPI0010AE6A56|nr:hypothetical protein [Polyangium aurulentum]UQA61825.1 hypothetical protein E8A73_015670 [Polyangium aurulentum]